MPLSNYSELSASVASWMNRSDLGSVIPDFIAIAESRINAGVRLREGIVEDTLTTTSGIESVALPTDWLEFATVAVGGKPMRYITVDALRARAELVAGGDTEYYSIQGANMLISPTPGDTAVTIDIAYYAKIDPLSTTSTNWLLTKYPNIYLYGALVSGFQYLMNDERANYFGLLYTQSVNLARATDQRATSSGSPLRIRTR